MSRKTELKPLATRPPDAIVYDNGEVTVMLRGEDAQLILNCWDNGHSLASAVEHLVWDRDRHRTSLEHTSRDLRWFAGLALAETNRAIEAEATVVERDLEIKALRAELRQLTGRLVDLTARCSAAT